MSLIAIIPARGGSKRLPRKNVLPILGKPMLTYPIYAAQNSKMFDRIIVSTEDDEIRNAALEAGAEVFQRPDELAGDRAKVVQVCKQVLDVLREQGETPAYFCCIYATAVFVSPEDLTNSFQFFNQDPSPDVVMGVSEFNLQPVQALEEKEGFLTPKWPEYISLQSQFQPKLTASNGTIYWARTIYFEQNPSFYCARLKGYPIPRQRAIDLDTQEDLDYARCVAEKILS
ncbi:acylneuraminate cytidylyltransferase family protein [uncultured Desulfobacter sp.]|uniref:acylneuraminate cytidylyltransferase family protein n=1 Tax=uncultured Desulfobacter sp. TaxID=240139 RepID=UPI002AA7BA08|nr:acylneuraminate cytidylyltransferase family protein [uncultured Desulfobacter sp.]